MRGPLPACPRLTSKPGTGGISRGGRRGCAKPKFWARKTTAAKPPPSCWHASSAALADSAPRPRCSRPCWPQAICARQSGRLLRRRPMTRCCCRTNCWRAWWRCPVPAWPIFRAVPAWRWGRAASSSQATSTLPHGAKRWCPMSASSSSSRACRACWQAASRALRGRQRCANRNRWSLLIPPGGGWPSWRWRRPSRVRRRWPCATWWRSTPVPLRWPKRCHLRVCNWRGTPLLPLAICLPP